MWSGVHDLRVQDASYKVYSLSKHMDPWAGTLTRIYNGLLGMMSQ